MKPKVKYISYGTGNRVGNIIYLNKHLKKYPKLHKAILSHEKKHTEDMELIDIWIDWNNTDLRGLKKEYYKFILKHPRALINFSPIMKIEDNWCIDIGLLVFYLFAFFVFFMVGAIVI